MSGKKKKKQGWFFYQLNESSWFINIHIKLARSIALCFLIKETDQMRVWISANKVQVYAKGKEKRWCINQQNSN